MADQRQPFRFRLPWLGGTPAPAPARPAGESQVQTRPPRPPFRPAGVAAVQPPPPPPRAEPPPPAPSRAVNQVRATSLPASTSSAATPSRAATQPPVLPKTEPSSPPPAATEPQTSPQKPTSPPPQSRAASRPPSPASPAAPSKPSTPSSSPIPQIQPLTKPPSPPKGEPRPIPEVLTSPNLLDDQSSSSLKEPEKPETQQDLVTVSENPSDTGKQPQSRMISDEVPPQIAPTPTQNLGSAATSPLLGSLQRSERKLEEFNKMEKVEEPVKEERKGMANGEEPKWKEVPQLPEPVPGPKFEPQVQPVNASQRLSREEIFQEKEVVAMSEIGRKPVETSIRPYPKVSRVHKHKPATSNGEKAPLHKEIKEDISKFVHKLGAGQGKQSLDGDKPFTVITLAGENRGSSMTLSNEVGKRERSIHIHRGYKSNPDESVETSTDAEESSSSSKKHEGCKEEEEMATKAYINSNVQGVNNSLVFNGSVSTGNPGVQYARSRNLSELGKGKHEAEKHVMLKDEFSVTPSEKLAYAPTVRRRCLRGLMLESSDSDADNPDKPRRHGCRYAGRDSDIDVL